MDTYSTGSDLPSGALLGLGLGWGIISLLLVVAIWMVFRKAGRPGWWAIIPIANTFVMCKIAGKPGWWFLLFLIPVVNIVIAILVLHGLSTNFGKGAGFTVGLVLLPFIFMPILGFGSARYIGLYGGRPAGY